MVLVYYINIKMDFLLLFIYIKIKIYQHIIFYKKLVYHYQINVLWKLKYTMYIMK